MTDSVFLGFSENWEADHTKDLPRHPLLRDRLYQLSHPATLAFYHNKDENKVEYMARTIHCFDLPDKFKTKLAYIDYLLDKYDDIAIGIGDWPREPLHSDTFCFQGCGQRFCRMVVVPNSGMGFVHSGQDELKGHRCPKHV